MLTTREEDGRACIERQNQFGRSVAIDMAPRGSAVVVGRRWRRSSSPRTPSFHRVGPVAVVSAVVWTSQGPFPSLLSPVTNLVLTRGQRLTRGKLPIIGSFHRRNAASEM